MPSGKAIVSGGVAPATRLHFGLNVCSMRRYAKRGVAALTVAELKQCRREIRFAFKIYRIDCASAAPTGTERRKALTKIKTAAARFAGNGGRPAAWALLTALDEADYDARKLAYKQLAAKGCSARGLTRSLRHWPIVPGSGDRGVVTAASELAGLDVDALAPLRGRFPEPGLAKLVASLIYFWKRVTGRTAALVSVDRDCEKKRCPFADWLAEMHNLLGFAPPPVGRVVDIVRWHERWKNPAPVTGGNV